MLMWPCGALLLSTETEAVAQNSVLSIRKLNGLKTYCRSLQAGGRMESADLGIDELWYLGKLVVGRAKGPCIGSNQAAAHLSAPIANVLVDGMDCTLIQGQGEPHEPGTSGPGNSRPIQSAARPEQQTKLKPWP